MAQPGLRRFCGSLMQRMSCASSEISILRSRACSGAVRAACISTTSADQSSEREQEIAQLIKDRMPGAKAVRVTDTSGGCGSMYRLEVAAAEFKGLSIVKQHQLVTKALGDEVSNWHGFVLSTKAAE